MKKRARNDSISVDGGSPTYLVTRSSIYLVLRACRAVLHDTYNVHPAVSSPTPAALSGAL